MSARLRTLIAGVVSLACTALLWLLVRSGATDGLDESLSGAVVREGFWHGTWLFIEDLFELWPMLAFNIVLVAVLALKGYRRAAIYSAGVNLAVAALSPLLKHLVGRDRPVWQETAEMYAGNGSFPSGHVAHAVALFGVGIVLIRIFVRKSGPRRLLITACVLVMTIVLLDRLLLGRHHLTDVLASIFLSTGIILIGWALFTPVPTLSAVISPVVLPAPPPLNRSCAVVLNPIKVESVDLFRATVNEIAAASGWDEPSYYDTTVEDSGTGQAAQAAADGAALVLVCGGDGTVREVCAELAGTGIPVGVIPAGTGNLLARNLEIPLYLRNAIDVAFTGQDRAIDMVEVSGDGMESSHFLVMAGMGFDAAIMEGANEQIKAKVGWLAYVVSGTKALMFPAVKLEVSVDGGEFTKHRARTVIVGNVGTLTAGMPLIPDAAIDDGLLDIVMLHPQRFWSWIPLAFRILTKRPHTDELINRMTGHEVVIRADRDTPRQLDGDPVGEGRELTMRTIPGRLLVRVPR